ncbi:hypothetical protein ACWGLF_38610 [Streptomyces puniciscabiei]
MLIIPVGMLTRVNGIHRLLAQTALPAGLSIGVLLIDGLGARGFLGAAGVVRA